MDVRGGHKSEGAWSEGGATTASVFAPAETDVGDVFTGGQGSGVGLEPPSEHFDLNRKAPVVLAGEPGDFLIAGAFGEDLDGHGEMVTELGGEIYFAFGRPVL